ncbi:hypothetical protein SAMN06296386_10377 [Lachnospiraceae bacterium]|nr:hypothetical protein SAMN06296386_10377 [Lachnospiraceae bacterium]
MSFIKKHPLALSVILSSVIFVFFYGIKILNPLYDEWIFIGKYDLAQHYTGWMGYRNSPWYFPLGVMDSLTYPDKACVIYTDSIPLLAIFFKLLSPILPSTFQYLGFYGIVVFALNGLFSALVIKKYTGNDMFAILGSMFFVISAQMMCTMIEAIALSSHYLILMSICIIAYRNDLSFKQKLIGWGVISGLATTIHLYLLLMSGVILCGFLLIDFLEKKKILEDLLYLASFLSVSVFLFAIVGGFSSNARYSAGYIAPGMDINYFFNSFNKYLLFDELPHYHTIPTFYLGAGMMFLSLVCIVAVLRELNREKIKRHLPAVIGFSFIFIVSYIIALTPEIRLNKEIIFTYQLPEALENMWMTFRCSRRLGWICIYLIMFAALCADRNTRIKKYKMAITVLALCIQLFDFSPMITNTHDLFDGEKKYLTTIDYNFMDSLVQEQGTEKFVFGSKWHMEEFMPLAMYAQKSKIKINTFYFARRVKHNDFKEIINDPKDTDLFIMLPDDEFVGCNSDKLNYYSVGGYVLASTKPLSALTPMEFE